MNENAIEADLSHLSITRRWRGQLHPIPSVLTIIRRAEGGDEQFLLIERLNSPYKGKWALVGGKWDFGERLATAAVREVREETGLETSFAAFRGIVDELMVPQRDSDEAGHFLLFICDLRVVGGEAQQQNEGRLGWFDWPQLVLLDQQGAIVPTDFAMLRRYVSESDNLPLIEAIVRNDQSSDRLELVAFKEH